MKIVEFIRDFFDSKSEILLNEKMIDISTQIAVQEFAIETAINLISGCISKCEFQTFMNNKEIKEDEYYLWNYEPNKNQNSTEFIQELVSKLLRNNECLIVESNGQLIIADSFNQNEYALVENIFEDVTRKDFTFKRKFRMSEVLYFKLNNKDIRILLSSLMDSYDNLLNLAVGKYKRSGGRKGVIKLDSILKGDETKKKEIEDLFTRKFKNYFEAENAIVDLPKGVEYEEKVDIQNLIKEAFERAAQAFKIPPSLLRGDIADIEKITDNFLTFCIDPIVDMISEEINRKRYGKTFVLKGTFIRIDTTCIKHIDIFAIAEKIDKLISTGMYSIDGLRRKVKDIALNEEWSGKHWITKNYSEITQIDSGGGGEGDE